MSQTHMRPVAAANGGGRSILLIDDDPHVAETLGELLTLEGFRVTTAADATSGLLRARADKPDLVLCDLTIRGELDGFGFAAACRADPALRLLRLAAVSGYDRPEDVRRAVDAGFDCLIGKPVDLALIYAALPPAPGAAS
jgi:two-component system CheB/CheR fusion protein